MRFTVRTLRSLFVEANAEAKTNPSDEVNEVFAELLSFMQSELDDVRDTTGENKDTYRELTAIDNGNVKIADILAAAKSIVWMVMGSETSVKSTGIGHTVEAGNVFVTMTETASWWRDPDSPNRFRILVGQSKKT